LVIWSAVFLVAISVLALRWRKQRPYFLTGWCWYLGNLVPSIGIVQIGAHSMADRYTYLPLIGVFIMLVGGVTELVAKFGSSGRSMQFVVRGGSAVVFLVLALCTWHQLAYWKDGVTLFTHATEVAPSSAMAHCLLAGNLATVHDYGLALVQAREALRLDPDSSNSLRYMGDALRNTGQLVESKLYYREALARNPGNKNALFGFASLLSNSEDPVIRNGTEAIPLAKRLCELTGNRYPKYLGLLGCAYAAAGRFPEAIETAQEALAIARRIHDYPSVAKLTDQLASFKRGKAMCENPGPLTFTILQENEKGSPITGSGQDTKIRSDR
jgi:protein O-mannosyl-transferase